MIKPPERVEVPEKEEARELFARLLAVLIVISTLAVALTEYLHATDHAEADKAGIEAQSLGIQRQGEVVREQDDARLQIDNYAFVEQELTLASNSLQQVLVTTDTSTQTHLEKEADLFQRIATLNGKFTKITPDGANSPSKDPRFPNLVLAQETSGSDRLFALQDAANERRQEFEKRLSLYEVVLTVLAVAIYLFGLSLTLPRQIGRALTALALVAFLGAAGFTATLQFTRPGTAPEAAADEYAAGLQALDGYYVTTGTDTLKQAEDHFTKAIDMRPTFAQAYVERADTRFLIGSPERTDSTRALSSPDALRSALDDLQKAQDLGLQSKELLQGLAFDRLLLGLEQSDGSLISQSLDASNAAARLDDQDPQTELAIGVAMLAQGNSGEARTVFERTIPLIVYQDQQSKTLRDPARAEEILAGAITQLDLLAAKRSDTAASVLDSKALLATGVGIAGGSVTGQPLTLTDIKAEVFPGQLQWDGTFTGYDPTKDVISTQWYRKDPTGLGWVVLPSVSGTFKASDVSAQGAGHIATLQNYLAHSVRCLDNGDYRAEVFINGKFSGKATATSSFGTLAATPMSELQLSMCRPTDWTHDGGLYIRGFADGFQSPDKSQAIYLFRIQNIPKNLTSNSDHEIRTIRDIVVNTMLNGKLPGTPTQTSEVSEYFLGLGHAFSTQYSMPNNQMLFVGTGIAGDGSVFSVAVFGQGPTLGDNTTVAQLYDSVIRQGEDRGTK